MTDAEQTDIVEQTDVVVMGAGVSGVQTARLLNLGDSSVNVVVLEARDRVGGRLRSPVLSGRRLDVGATWFWPNERRINALLAELNVGSYPQHLHGHMVFDDGSGSVRRAPNQLDVPSGRVVDGFEALVERMAKDLAPDTIRFDTPATSVRSADGGLTVTTSTGLIAARHVVVAMPPALAVSTIDFGGELDERVASVAAQTPVWMGGTVKVVTTYEQPFWRDEGLAGSAFSYAGPMRELHDMSGPDGEPAAIFGFCALEPTAPAPDREAIVEQMVTLFGPGAAEPTDVEIVDWRAEPFTVTPELVGLTNYRTYGHDTYQQPSLNGSLHWASTETAIEMPGHVEGALAAAERVASTIHSTLAKDPV